MKKPPARTERKRDKNRKSARRARTIVNWALAAAAVVVVVYGVSQMSGIAYTDKDIRVVDFSMLSPEKKTAALKEANAARCNCGCGMTLAQCVSTDSTCPIRETNIDRIKTMVRDADRP